MKDKQMQIVMLGGGYAWGMTAVRLAGKFKRRQKVPLCLHTKALQTRAGLKGF